MNLINIITPAISPLYLNNPGYTIMNIELEERPAKGEVFVITDLNYHFFDLMFY
jgi:hypothetical protein